jgi:hypothetical protein
MMLLEFISQNSPSLQKRFWRPSLKGNRKGACPELVEGVRGSGGIPIKKASGHFLLHHLSHSVSGKLFQKEDLFGALPVQKMALTIILNFFGGSSGSCF